MEKIKITNGVYWVGIPEEDLYILCGCPADVVKHLMIRGLIAPKIKNGVTYETGPNAILLSDLSIQNGQLSNLAEFPILQMLYRQGMIVPQHPNNIGKKPLLIGHPSQLSAQSEYIRRGNYGLTSVDEIKAAGISPDTAEEMYRIKLKFAFGNIKNTEELLDFCPVESGKAELRNGVKIRRRGFNVFEFTYKDENVLINLNLDNKEEYKPPILLDYHKVNREYFSIIHIGEGDGWDVTKPCMSSILTYQGKIFLIDTGPNVLHSLMSLGISVNEISGIFHTHAHDDHFSGLTSLVRSDHKIHYYATPLVRASVTKKLSALMSISEQRFSNTFIVHDLNFSEWNNIDGLEVMPVYSPHPVDTSVLFFRTFWEGGYRTYAHLADISSRKIVEGILQTDDCLNKECRAKLMEPFMQNINSPVDRKKIDVGGGMIHGQALDFKADKSKKIFLSHLSRELTPEEKEIGSNATFGQEDVLIPSNKDYLMQSAFIYLREYFPTVPNSDINMLLNCPQITYNVGEIIIKKGEINQNINLILGGVSEVIDSESGFLNRLSAGSFIGELSALNREPSRRTYRAYSYVQALCISDGLYQEFIKRNFAKQDLLRVYETMSYLQSTYLFGEMVSSTIQHNLAKKSKNIKLQPGEPLIQSEGPQIILVISGEASIVAENRTIEKLSPGDYFGEETILLGSANIFKAEAKTQMEIMTIPGEILKGIPIVEWKLMEAFEKRLQAFGTKGA